MAGLYVENNEIGFKYTGVTVNVPDNDVARLMYYLKCVCTAIECEENSEIRRFTNYENWTYLSIDEQKLLLDICYTFGPDVFDDQVFFQNDVLCGNSLNDFLEISEVRQQLIAVRSIVIAGQTRKVNKVMVYKREWMDKYYWKPLQGLLRRLGSSTRPAITHTTPSRRTHTPTPTSIPITPIEYPRSNRNGCCSCCDKACVIGAICGFSFVLAFIIGIVVYFLVKT